MPKNRRRSLLSAARGVTAIAAAVVLGLAGCASHRPVAAVRAPSPGEVYLSLLGRNPGLNSLRAVAEVRIAYAGNEVSLPGVLQLDRLGGFRLDLLDPLDRPLAILFVEEGRVVHYRPAQRLAASLGVFSEECRGIDPAEWVPAILASSVVPVAGEVLTDGWMLWGGRVLERHRGGEIHQSVRYRNEAGEALPRQVSWYCGEDSVLQLRMLEWVKGLAWRLPSRFEIGFPQAGLTIHLEIREIEANPAPSSQPFRPRLGTDIRWTSWNLPQ